MSADLLASFYARQLAAAEGSFQEWTSRRATLTPGAVERALCVLVKTGGSLLDALPFLKAKRVDAGEALDSLARVLVLLEGLATGFSGQSHGVLGGLQLRQLGGGAVGTGGGRIIFSCGRIMVHSPSRVYEFSTTKATP